MPAGMGRVEVRFAVDADAGDRDEPPAAVPFLGSWTWGD